MELRPSICHVPRDWLLSYLTSLSLFRFEILMWKKVTSRPDEVLSNFVKCTDWRGSPGAHEHSLQPK
ncbi:hypothetical protein CBM2586_A10289 [Cupriavidus phytorum]|uniref:Uncharacterized protein n=1 Tax=Cupriavidus taiwanensis TaxID=164546 RepID=A0A375B9Q8_9BURK|nr:hypothetical protein CBM2586_A10289 [Cupriavidus taiwanensis]